MKIEIFEWRYNEMHQPVVLLISERGVGYKLHILYILYTLLASGQVTRIRPSGAVAIPIGRGKSVIVLL